MKKQHVLMAVALLVVIWLAFFADKSADEDVVQPVVKTAAKSSTVPSLQVTTRSTSSSASRNEKIIPILALASRSELISVGHTDLNGKKVASTAPIFGTQSWVPPPPPVPVIKNPPPPPPPTAPPLRFTFIGKKQEAGVWEVYLARGDDSFIVHNQSVIDGVYRVDAITPAALVLTYLPLNQVQRLNIQGVE